MAKNKDYEEDEDFDYYEEEDEEEEIVFNLNQAQDIKNTLLSAEKEKTVEKKKRNVVEKITIPVKSVDKKMGTFAYYVLENLYIGSSENKASMEMLELILKLVENKANEFKQKIGQDNFKIVLGGNIIARKYRQYDAPDLIKTVAEILAPHAERIVLAINGPEEDEYKAHPINFKYKTEEEYESLNPLTQQIEVKRKTVEKTKKMYIDPMFEILKETENIWRRNPKNAGKEPLNLVGKYTNTRSKTLLVQFVDPVNNKKVLLNHFRTFRSIKTNALTFSSHGRILRQSGQLQKVDAVHCTCSNQTFKKSTGTYQASKERGEDDIDEFAPKEAIWTSGLMEYQRMPGNAQDKLNALAIRYIKVDCFNQIVERAKRGIRKQETTVTSSMFDLRPGLFFNYENKDISQKYAYQVAYNNALDSEIYNKVAAKRELANGGLYERSVKERNENDQKLVAGKNGKGALAITKAILSQ